MSTNAAAPDRPFEVLWSDLAVVLPPGTVVSKYYGRALSIRTISGSKVTIDSPDAGGVVDVPKCNFEAVYADWRNYRYERLSGANSQDELHVISIIDHVVQTWVRRDQRVELIERARKAGVPDGIFWVVNYNRDSRFIGPRPVGEPVLVSEVFPEEPMPRLSELESAATSLYEAASELSRVVYSKSNVDAVGVLSDKHPGFGRDVYGSVVGRACYSASR
jgi:hypothetical protein